MRLKDAGDLHRPAGRLEHYVVVAAEALGEQLEHLGLGLDPPGVTDHAALCDRDLAEVAMDIQRDCAHACPFGCDRQRAGARWANDNYGFGLAAQPFTTACPTCVSPGGPCPDQPTLCPAPDGIPRRSFMPAGLQAHTRGPPGCGPRRGRARGGGPRARRGRCPAGRVIKHWKRWPS